ncbi:DNA mismatch repair protein MLH1 [Apostasia shenzhenica]|uniref:DNA mismatch repair protein MLH1 n=1 Tax=Apostasia shenzhenica TaxID=1088818 RepID=A0A2I0BG22_9ASPA|nr:DNA mismatch repair protein MLH1 [Apostasia shenzhenica]
MEIDDDLERPAVSSPEPEALRLEPPRILRLDESVVNRIAAGEVVQRPVSAVKELVENSLDAGATSISVVVKDGGLKLIQVSDNGHGIRVTCRYFCSSAGLCVGRHKWIFISIFEDLPILCERHTTSKLSTYEDLQTIKSMGFRGEALASMTYVGHVTVTSITDGQLHGYRASYKDGVMEHEAKPCAAVKGTQIMVENLFYNMIARRKTLQNSNDDYPKIVDLISRFAIHHTNVGFSCRKHGANKADVHSVAVSCRLDAIKIVYGASVAHDLTAVTVSDNNLTRSVFEMDGFISNANYIAKKTTMVLFINDRLVECTPLKRAIEVAYSATLPKASKPFIFMSIKVPTEHVDVNVHPTKREVSLLNQESIVNTIQDAVESKLMTSNTTRTFHMQAINSTTLSHFDVKRDSHENSSFTGVKSQKVPVHKMIRTDSRDPSGRLLAYLQDRPGSQNDKKPDLDSVSNYFIKGTAVAPIIGKGDQQVHLLHNAKNAVRLRRNPKEASDLTSIQELIRDIDCNVHYGLYDIIKNCTYVGLADEVFALLQYNTHLYLVDVVNVSKELMYQQVIRRFGNFNAIKLSEPAPLLELLMMALNEEDLDSTGEEDDGFRKKIAEMNAELLMKKAELLDEYLSIHIDQQMNLLRLPVVLDQHTPDMDHVPEFLLTLGNDVGANIFCLHILLRSLPQVDWTSEKECFQTIAAAIGNFYSVQPPVLPNPSGNGIQFYKRNKGDVITNTAIESTNSEGVLNDDVDHELLAEAETAWAQREWTIQHVLFPAMRLFLKPPKAMATDGTFVQLGESHGMRELWWANPLTSNGRQMTCNGGRESGSRVSERDGASFALPQDSGHLGKTYNNNTVEMRWEKKLQANRETRKLKSLWLKGVGVMIAITFKQLPIEMIKIREIPNWITGTSYGPAQQGGPSPSAPWVVHEKLAKQHGISTIPPRELTDKFSGQNGSLECNGYGKRGGGKIVLDTQKFGHKQKKTRTENGHFLGSQIEEPIKYPIDDLLVKPSVDDPVFTDRPSPSTDFRVPLDCVGDLLMIWNFCISFGRLLHLWPFSLQDFENALCHKDSELMLILECHAAILQLLIKDEGDYFLAIKNRKQNSKVKLTNWAEYLCHFLEMSDRPGLSDHIAIIKRGHYGLLDIHVKLGILKELVIEALLTNAIRAKLDECIEQQQLITARKREEVKIKKEEKFLSNEIDSKKMHKEHTVANGLVVYQRRSTSNSLPTNSDGIRDANGKVHSAYKKDIMRHGNTKDIKMPNGLKNTNTENHEKKSDGKQGKHLEGESEKLSIRTNYLGKDRNYNRYWFFRREGRLFVEGLDSDKWGYYSTKEELDALIGSLNEKGERERDLNRQLEKYYVKISNALQKRSKSIAEKALIQETELRRSTRVRAQPRCSPAMAFLRYANKWKERSKQSSKSRRRLNL